MSSKTKTWKEFQSCYDYYKFNHKNYSFEEVLRKIFYDYQGPFDELHKHMKTLKAKDESQLGFDDFSSTFTQRTDQSSIFHRIFYNSVHFTEFTSLYQKWVQECVLPLFDAEDNEFAIQTSPTFRIQTPQTTALGQNDAITCPITDAIGWHNDSMYFHPSAEINFITAITPMFDTNTIWFETSVGSNQYEAVIQNPGTFFHFYGSKCHHFNKLNQTNKTRISFDFRIIPMSQYSEDDVKFSVTQGKSFKLGEYYTLLKR